MKTWMTSFPAVLALACSGAVDPGASTHCRQGQTNACAVGDGGPDEATVGTRVCEEAADGNVWGACQPAPCSGGEMACVTASGKAGVAQCALGAAISACGEVDGCHPGDTQAGTQSSPACFCELHQGRWSWDSGCWTPLVLSFGGRDVEFTSATGDFDLAGQEASVDTRWVSAATPWLALDRNGNGSIDDGRELFGSMTELGDGTRAPNGFAALETLDEDGDGAITTRDAGFSRLLLWSDANQNRRSEPAELTPLGEAGVTVIQLAYHVAPRCHDGDCEVERAHFVFRDARSDERQGDVIDVHFAQR